MEELICIVVAAGSGKRLGLGYNKAFALIAGVPLLVRTLAMLADTGFVTRAIVALSAAELVNGEKLLAFYRQQYFAQLPLELVAGGSERQDSVANALTLISDNDVYVAVHDGARPFAGREVFRSTFDKARQSGAAIAAVPAKDTVKVAKAGIISTTPERSTLWLAQTPQIFRADLLKRAYTFATAAGVKLTDDAAAVELLGEPVALALGDYNNIKVTTPEDLAWAEKFVGGKMSENLTAWRVGSGFDVHRLVPERQLILCGVKIPYELGLLGHSDADVALHALMDALLGAAGLGDIGKHFPDNDVKYKDADSGELTRAVVKLLAKNGWRLNNADVTIIAERPKLAGYIPKMRAKLAQILGVAGDCINIKATTTEKLGFTGRGEGIAAEAVVSLVK